MSARIQAFVVSLIIGLLLPAVFVGGLAITAALVAVIAAMILWLFKVVERPQPDMLLPIVGLVVGILVALVTAPLLPMPFAAVAIAAFVLFA